MLKQRQQQVQALTQKNHHLEQALIDAKQHYEQIIQGQQHGNLILTQNNNINTESHLQIPSNPDQTTILKQLQQSQQENTELKREMAEMTQTYQEQIQQISAYFNRIKQSYHQREQGDSLERSISQTEIVTLYDKMLKDFSEERQKYVDKIEELLCYIAGVESSSAAGVSQCKQLQLQLSICRQQLKMHRRGK